MDLEPDDGHDADALQTLYAKTLYTLRESRKAMLKQYVVDNEAALLEKIRSSALEEHPAYEHYLSALIIEQTRLHVRAQAATQLSGVESEADAGISIHLMLKDKIEERYGNRLIEPVRLAHDALLLGFDSGLMAEVRYFSRDEYSIAWTWGEAELRVDTVPIHTECATFPHHLHDDTGVVRKDPASCPGIDCWTNFSHLIDRLLVDPLLENGEATPELNAIPRQGA